MDIAGTTSIVVDQDVAGGIPYETAWYDVNGHVNERQEGVTNGAVEVEIVPAPGGGNTHSVTYVLLVNGLAATATPRIRTNTGGVYVDLWSGALAHGEAIYMDLNDTWTVYTQADLWGFHRSIESFVLPPGGGGGGPVASVFGRIGAVVAADGDYLATIRKVNLYGG